MARKKYIHPLGDKSYYDENRTLRLMTTGTFSYVVDDPKIDPCSHTNTHIILDAKTLKEIARLKTYSLFYKDEDDSTYTQLQDIIPLKNIFILIEAARFDKTDVYKTLVYNYKGKVLESQVFRLNEYNEKEYVASKKEKYKNYVPEKIKN